MPLRFWRRRPYLLGIHALVVVLGVDALWRRLNWLSGPWTWFLVRWHWLYLLVVLLLVVLVACVLVLPRLLVMRDVGKGDFAQLSTAERATALNDARTTLLSALAGAVLLIGLFLTARQVWLINDQLRVARESQIEATLDSIQNGFIEITRTFVEHPQLRPVFYESECPPNGVSLSPEDKPRATALAELTLDTFESVIEQGDAVRNDYMPYIRDAFTESQFLVGFLSHHEAWYRKLVDFLSHDEAWYRKLVETATQSSEHLACNVRS